MTLSPFDDGYVAPKPKPAEPKAPRSHPMQDVPFFRAGRAKAEKPKRERGPTDVADGIYFSMPDDVYRGIERLSTSGIQSLLVSPATFWERSWLNPANAEKDDDADETKARKVGKAYHTARLEPHLFDAKYVRELDKADFPKTGAHPSLITGDDMKAALKDLGLPQSGSVGDQAARLEAAGYPGLIWQTELAKWEDARGDRVGLPAKIFDEIAIDMERIRKCEPVAALLVDGAAEVSIFWTCPKTAIPMKARVDYLQPAAWADFKTFDNSRRLKVEQAIANAFRYNRYYIQAVNYREPVEAIRHGIVQIVGEATDEQRAVIAAIQMRPAPLECWYIFQEKGGTPNILGRQFMFKDVPPSHRINRAGLSAEQEAEVVEVVGSPTQICAKAEQEITWAKRLFLGYSQIYARGEPWFPFEPLSTISDDDFNPKWLDGSFE